MSKPAQFLSRLPAGAPQDTIVSVATAFEISARAAAQIAKIRTDQNLTRAGQAIQVEKMLKDGPLGHLAKIRSDVAKRLSDLTAQRGVLRQRVLGGDNFPKELKSEVREYLRELDPVARMKAVNSDDPLIREAALGAPHYLSGLPQDIWEHAAAAAVEAVHGEHLEQIDVLETAYREAQAAVQVAMDDIRRAAEIDAREFEKLAV